MNLEGSTAHQTHQVGVYFAAAEAVMKELGVEVIKGKGGQHQLSIEGQLVRVFVHASHKTELADFLWECRRAVELDPAAEVVVLVDLRGDPVFHVVRRLELLRGDRTSLKGWAGRWDMARRLS